jgi:uncharacterized tellurite resistance protein B-like protein
MAQMTPLESLHYAIGEIAYSIASADGFVQPEERIRFHDIVTGHLNVNDYDFTISEIIFTILNRDKRTSADAYNWAIREIKLNSHYLSPDLKKSFLTVVNEVSKAYPPVTKEESTVIAAFLKAFEPLKGDPVFYRKK